MSIVALKRKTQAKYNNMSVGQPQFSINGVHRNQGYVGQTSLSRSLPKTLMKGNTIKGHGGCCGTYRVTPVVQSAVTSLNDNTVIKPSVIGTDGMLATKYRWTRRPQPFAVVKPDTNNNINDQQDYITRLRKRALQVANDAYQPPNDLTTLKSINVASPDNSIIIPQCTFTKPDSDFVAMTQDNYLLQKHNNCTQNDVVYIPSKNNGGPILGKN